TYKWYAAALASGVLAVGFILVWLWTGTAVIPEKQEKHVGRGVTLPLYMSGPRSVGWWAMFITMLGDMAAFAGLVFGYFFYWTIHADFPPGPARGPGLAWPTIGFALLCLAWALTLLARKTNHQDRPGLTRIILLGGSGAAVLGAAGSFAGPWLAGLDPTRHVYPATVWVLTVWLLFHIGAGLVMQLYCVARSYAARLTAEHDIDIWNVALYWHFLLVTAVVTWAVLALFPMVA